MEDHVLVFRASLKRCLAHPDFLRHFYHLFLASSDEVREKFQHTDLERQARVLADSLYMMAVVAEATAPEEGPETGPAWSEL